MLCILLSLSFAINCTDASPNQMICQPKACMLDEIVDLNCTVFHSTICTGERNFIISNVSCRYCFMVPTNQTTCKPLTNCIPSMGFFTTKCYSNVYCMGSSIFEKRAKCLRSKLSMTTALVLSIFFGGFGIDRFYLGYGISGVFKLLTFGGFGAVYMIDIFLIAFGFLGPSDGSLFPERI